MSLSDHDDDTEEEEWADDPSGFDDILSQELDRIESSQASSSTEIVASSQETVILSQETPADDDVSPSPESPPDLPSDEAPVPDKEPKAVVPEKKQTPAKVVSEADQITKSGCVIDARLQEIDDTPSPRRLFRLFDERFFEGRLSQHKVQIKWSEHMTLCAGKCEYFPQEKRCVIKLSIPLLGEAAREDLVHTLLHEMIHADLFVTEEEDDREEHGPEFTKRMALINTKGLCYVSLQHKIPVKWHIWQCDGPCSRRPPMCGTFKSSQSRAPGAQHKWFSDHETTCGGTFRKVAGPDMKRQTYAKAEPKAAGNKGKSKGKVGTPVGTKSIKSFFQVVKKAIPSPRQARKAEKTTVNAKAAPVPEVIQLD